jgi:hypothetical protein
VAVGAVESVAVTARVCEIGVSLPLSGHHPIWYANAR